MYNDLTGCPPRYIRMVEDFVNGDSEKSLEEIEEILDDAFENGKISSPAFSYLCNLLYE